MDRNKYFHSNSSNSSNSLIVTNSIHEKFDIRDYMNYDIIKKILIKHPTECALFEIVCILINNCINDKYNDDKK